jgi:5-methylcytosine-specific restriction protein A
LDKPLFTIEQVYKRSDIHDRYGGNRQSGIAASANFPYIFIFSGDAGHQHGYKDQWENKNVFSYTGEGQLNDMRFVKGNLELRDHVRNGKRVFLFIYVQKGYVRFESELVLNDFDYFIGPDREGNERIAIKFFFRRAGIRLAYETGDSIAPSMVAEPELAKLNIPNETERKGLVTSRVGQGAYRKSILYRWQFKCAVTNYSKKEILIASHIVPWKDATNEERLDVSNGILLSPTYDALFDQRLISFENNGKIILSDSLSKTNYLDLGVTGKEIVKNFSSENKTYLERHRASIE